LDLADFLEFLALRRFVDTGKVAASIV